MSALLEQLIAEGVLKTPRIIAAFQCIKRRDFLRPETLAAADGNYPLAIGYGQTISQPLTVAFMLELLVPQPGEKILDVGAGSGWQTALLAYIVSKNVITPAPLLQKEGRAYAIERIPELAQFARDNINKYNFITSGVVELRQGDGWHGWLEAAPFDKIIVAAAAAEIPLSLKKQLKVGGRFVLPVGFDQQSIVVLDKKSESEFEQCEYPGFVFVPLVKKMC